MQLGLPNVVFSALPCLALFGSSPARKKQFRNNFVGDMRTDKKTFFDHLRNLVLS